MNSVTQKKAEATNQHTKGIEKEGVLLFCCILFCVVQIFYIVDFPMHFDIQQESLVVSANQTLSLETDTHLASSRGVEISNLSSSYHLAPFFFQPLAINYCDKSLLMSIRGIGPSLAGQILETRKRIGYFSTPDDLLLVKGIGKTRMHKFSPLLNFSYDHE